MAKAHVKVHKGGLAAAVDFYGSAPTPNLILLETRVESSRLIQGLEQLAEVCDAGSRGKSSACEDDGVPRPPHLSSDLRCLTANRNGILEELALTAGTAG